MIIIIELAPPTITNVFDCNSHAFLFYKILLQGGKNLRNAFTCRQYSSARIGLFLRMCEAQDLFEFVEKKAKVSVQLQGVLLLVHIRHCITNIHLYYVQLYRIWIKPIIYIYTHRHTNKLTTPTPYY